MSEEKEETIASEAAPATEEVSTTKFKEEITPQEALASKEAEQKQEARPIEAVYDVPVVVSVVLGNAKMRVSDLLKLSRGSVVELDRRIGETVDIYVNNRLVAKGEVVSIDDKLAITMTDVMKILK